MNGRKEKRVPKRFVVLLCSRTKPEVTECATTENISDNGVRVRTVRPWIHGTRVLVNASLGECSAQAKVVYCETLPDSTFALGLEFLAGTSARVMR